MHGTCYSVAFEGDRFLMVWHRRRKGWEMPGGHIIPGETPWDAAAREYREESGYTIEIVAVRDIGTCYVCAAVLGEKVFDKCEMESELFSELPGELSFDRAEYLDTVEWARKAVREYLSRRPPRYRGACHLLYRHSASALSASPPYDWRINTWQECTLEERGSPAPPAR